MSDQTFPFAAIVGQESLKHAIILTAIDASLGGVLAFGDRGTGKTTAIRGLASLLPDIEVVKGCKFNCDPHTENRCAECASLEVRESQPVSTPVVDLPLGVTEDRLIGALDIERALVDGTQNFQPGLLAQANRGFLYIDEINLLDDHLVDMLLDVAASGKNVVEREGLSIRHDARFVLVGSGNPEEGELRPQLIDRFGLSVDVETPKEISQRVEIIKRRDDYERDPQRFVRRWKSETGKLRNRIINAKALSKDITMSDENLRLIAEICISLGTDGLRGELTLIKASRAQAAWNGKSSVSLENIRDIAAMALSHRLRRDPLDDSRGTVRVERILEDIFSKSNAA